MDYDPPQHWTDMQKRVRMCLTDERLTKHAIIKSKLKRMNRAIKRWFKACANGVHVPKHKTQPTFFMGIGLKSCGPVNGLHSTCAQCYHEQVIGSLLPQRFDLGVKTYTAESLWPEYGAVARPIDPTCHLMAGLAQFIEYGTVPYPVFENGEFVPAYSPV